MKKRQSRLILRPHYRLDMTFAVDWALKTNDLSIYSETFLERPFLTPRTKPSISRQMFWSIPERVGLLFINIKRVALPQNRQLTDQGET